MLKRFIIWNIKCYQKYISPMKKFHCPYHPSCSNYALEAVMKHGVWKGGRLVRGEYADAIHGRMAGMTRCRERRKRL